MLPKEWTAAFFSVVAFAIVLDKYHEPVIVHVPSEPKIVKIEIPGPTKYVEVCSGQAPNPERLQAGGLQRTDTWERTEEQAIRLARWCVVEDACVLWPQGKGNKEFPKCGTGGALSDECMAIIEVAVNNRKKSHEDWDEVLSFMSPRIMGDEEPTEHRAEWVKGLPAEGDDPPPFWRDSRDFDKHADGDWRLYKDKWVAFRQNVINYWMNGPEDVCEGSPLAEGTFEDAEQIAIPKRGFVRYHCRGVQRLWIGGPPLTKTASAPTLSAEVASAGF